MFEDVYLLLSWRETFTNVDGGGVVLDKTKDVAHSRKEEFECVGGKNYAVVKRGSKPQVKDIVGDTCKQDKSPADQGQISVWSTQIGPDDLVLAPHLRDDFRCEGVRAKKKDGKSG